MSKPQYVPEPHNFTGHILHWRYCVHCGLIRLNNRFTDWSVRMGCNNDEHPDFEKMRRLTRPPGL